MRKFLHLETKLHSFSSGHVSPNLHANSPNVVRNEFSGIRSRGIKGLMGAENKVMAASELFPDENTSLSTRCGGTEVVLAEIA